MKSNTTHNPPPVPLEDLGDGTAYYNFNVVEETIEEDEGGSYQSYNYDQVRVKRPVTVEKIEAALRAEGYKHTVDLEK